MGRIVVPSRTLITIAGTQLPAAGAEPWWSNDNGVGGAHPAATRASLDLGTLAAGDLDTVIEAVAIGPGGNDIRVRAVGDSDSGDGVTLDWDEWEPLQKLVIHFEDGVSTVADVEAAIAALAGQQAIVQVKTAGTGATILDAATDEFIATALAGGVNPGHNVSGHGVDGAILRVRVSNWNALAGFQVVAQTTEDADGSGAYDYLQLAPAMATTHPHLDVSGGKLVVKSSLGTAYGIALRIDLPATRRCRFGLVANDAGAVANFACTLGAEFLRDLA